MKEMMWIAVIALCVVGTTAVAADMGGPGMQGGMGGMGMQRGMGGMRGMGMQPDERISLGVQGPRKQHQLARMRSHLEAVSDIVDALARGEFDSAAQTAQVKLGMTPQMKRMCNGFQNEDFRNLALAFHASADDLVKALKTHDTSASLQALRVTMQYCTSCHSTYRQ